MKSLEGKQELKNNLNQYNHRINCKREREKEREREREFEFK